MNEINQANLQRIKIYKEKKVNKQVTSARK